MAAALLLVLCRYRGRPRGSEWVRLLVCLLVHFLVVVLDLFSADVFCSLVCSSFVQSFVRSFVRRGHLTMMCRARVDLPQPVPPPPLSSSQQGGEKMRVSVNDVVVGVVG